MSKQVRWLWKESEGWVRNGLITDEQANRIRLLYPEPRASLPWGTILFSGLGAIIAGLGVILLLAYNWHAISREVKLVIVMSSVALIHSAGAWLFLRPDWRKQMGEAICLLGTMLFGAGIWLVAQAYHIEEHFPNAFLIWGLGAMAMGWVMPSMTQALLGTVLLAIWGCAEGWGFESPMHWAPLLILCAGAPLAWHLRSSLLVLTVLLATLLTLWAGASAASEAVVLRVMFCCCVAAVGTGILARRTTFPRSALPLTLVGWTGSLLCMFLLSFVDIVDDLLGWRGVPNTRHLVHRAIYDWGSLILALGSWIVVAVQSRKPVSERDHESIHLEDWLLPLAALVSHAVAWASLRDHEAFVAGVFNLVLLAVAASWMARGILEARLRAMVLGSVLLILLAFARYFDLFDSLAIRGAVFLAVGALLFFQGVVFRRTRNRLKSANVGT